MSNIPRVSIVTAAFNRSTRILRTVESVVNQSYRDFEYLVVDDGSQDDTAAVVAQCADSRVRCITQQNGGQAAARNTGLAAARGEYIAFLDHDDVWLPEKLELQVRCLDDHPEFGVVYGRWRCTDEDGSDGALGDTFAGQGWVYADLLREHNFLISMSLPMLRTELVRSVGGFDLSTDISDDLDLFLKLARITQFGFLPALLLKYNVGNPAQQTKDTARVFRSEFRCIQRHLRNGPMLSHTERTAVARSWGRIFGPGFREQGWQSLRRRDYARAWHYYVKAIRLQPSNIRDRLFVRDLGSLGKGLLLDCLRGRWAGQTRWTGCDDGGQ